MEAFAFAAFVVGQFHAIAQEDLTQAELKICHEAVLKGFAKWSTATDEVTFVATLALNRNHRLVEVVADILDIPKS